MTDQRQRFAVQGRGDPGSWHLVGVGLDRAGRRGLWYRLVGENELQLCAGREGGDAFVSLATDQPVSPSNFAALIETLECAISAIEYQHTTGCQYFHGNGLPENEGEGSDCNCGALPCR